MSKAHFRRAIHSIAGGAELAHLHPRANRTGIAELFDEHQRWFSHKNVVGIGLGRKIKQGKRLGPALQVFVRHKHPLATVIDAIRIPASIDGRAIGYRGKLDVDVRGVGHPRRQSFIVVDRPAMPGYNVGDASGASGTIGCAVRDRASGALLGLSCAHVLAPGGAAAGAPIYVPSFGEAMSMGVVGQAEIGTLAGVGKIEFSAAAGITNVDAATFAPALPGDLSNFIATIGTPSGVRASVTEGVKVRKVGAISGDTRGVVQSTLVCVKTDVTDAAGVTREAMFHEQIGITRFTEAGDSGSLVLDEDNRAVGLHFWVADALSVCQPIQRVLDALGCDLVY